MNRAIWNKAIADAWRQLVLSALLLFAFAWIFTWLMSRFPVGAWGKMLNLLPDFFQPMIGIPVAKLATPLGQLSILYLHVVTLLVCAGWSLGRGSNSVSGEIGRGTMDLILSLPVWRMTVLAVPFIVATVGTVVLVAAVWLGTVLGLKCFKLDGPVSPLQLLPGAVNLVCMTFCLTAITTLISVCNRDRWRTIVLSGGFYVLSFILKMVGRMWPPGAWIARLSFLSAFEPQELILLPNQTERAVQCNLTLIAAGLVCFVLAALIFWKKDIPAPR